MLYTIPWAKVCNRPNYHWFVVGTVCVGAFMAALDASIMNIALPSLQRNFRVGMSDVEWISLVYLLTLAAIIVPFGRLADMWGRRLMYTFGFLVFVVGSGLCGFTSSFVWLLLFRVVQAIGAAMLQANSVAIITAAVPGSVRGKAIGIQASAQAIGLSIGPAVGGALLSLFSWRWIFFVNLPIGLMGLLLGWFLLPVDQPSPLRERFDFMGTALFVPALIALIYVLNRGSVNGWTSGVGVLCEMVIVLCLAGFVYTESRIEFPLVDFSLFRNSIFTLGSISGVLSFAVMYAASLLSPFYLDNVLRLNTWTTGLYLTLIPMGMAFCTPFAGALADKYGARTPATIGMSCAIVGSVFLSRMGPGHSYVYLIAGLVTIGGGMGIFTPPNNSQVMGSVPPERLGVAGGILNMSRTLGMGLGVTCGGLTYQLFVAWHGARTIEQASVRVQVAAFHDAYLVVAGIACLALLVAALSKLPNANWKR